MLEPGRIVEGLRVEQVLGKGSTSVVYLVRDPADRRAYALKVLTSDSPAVRARMLREGDLQSRIDHPNVVRVRRVLQVHGAPALLMDYVDGPALGEALRRYRITLPDAEALFTGILAGVHGCHTHRFVHRDIKPSNVLLATSAHGFLPKLSDFGIAKEMEDHPEAELTRAGAAMGTPPFMAPEQIRDAGDVDQRADIWSLGCVLYELVTRHRAFPGQAPSAVYAAVQSAMFTPPRHWVPELPGRVENAILGCLQPDREARIPDCITLARVLEGELAWAVAPSEMATMLPETFGAPPPPPASAVTTVQLDGPAMQTLILDEASVIDLQPDDLIEDDPPLRVVPLFLPRVARVHRPIEPEVPAGPIVIGAPPTRRRRRRRRRGRRRRPGRWVAAVLTRVLALTVAYVGLVTGYEMAHGELARWLTLVAPLWTAATS